MSNLENTVEKRIDDMSQDLCNSLQQITKHLTEVQLNLNSRDKETLITSSVTLSRPSQILPRATSMNQMIVKNLCYLPAQLLPTLVVMSST